MNFINQSTMKAMLSADKQQMEQETWRLYLTIDGNHCNPEQRVGYCWSRIHRGCLTLPLMQQHECLQKQCPHLQKYEEHSYWKGRNKRKEQQKKRKSQEKACKKKLEEILNIIRALTEDDDDFFAISVEQGKGIYQHQYIVRFVRFAWIDIQNYTKLFREKCGVSVYIQEIQKTHDDKLKMLEMYGLQRNIPVDSEEYILQKQEAVIPDNIKHITSAEYMGKTTEDIENTNYCNAYHFRCNTFDFAVYDMIARNEDGSTEHVSTTTYYNKLLKSRKSTLKAIAKSYGFTFGISRGFIPEGAGERDCVECGPHLVIHDMTGLNCWFDDGWEVPYITMEFYVMDNVNVEKCANEIYEVLKDYLVTAPDYGFDVEWSINTIIVNPDNVVLSSESYT